MPPPISRRSLVAGLVSLVAAPAIVRVSSIMPVRGTPMNYTIGRGALYFRGEPIGTITDFGVYPGPTTLSFIENSRHVRIMLEEFNFENLRDGFLGGTDAPE